MSTNCGVEPLSCTGRAWALGRSSRGWVAAAFGPPSGCAGFEPRGGRGFGSGVGRPSGGLGEHRHEGWAGCWHSARSSSRIAPAPRALRGWGLRRSDWSWSSGAFDPFPPSVPSSGSSGSMATPRGSRADGRARGSRILHPEPATPGISSRPIWWALAPSAAPEGSRASLPFTPLRWWGVAWPPPGPPQDGRVPVRAFRARLALAGSPSGLPDR